MSKAEEFKAFVNKHPELASYVKDKKHTWQEFYEIYDLYGENNSVWDKYQDETRALPIKEITTLIKGVKIDSVQKYITNAQKAINVVQELTNKPISKIKPIPKTPRPIHKFFGD